MPYDFTSVHLRRNGGEHKSAAYRALNPQALVPTLEAGGHVLTQSLAILEWLDESQPDPPLLPANPFERAEVRAFAQIVACEIHPLQNLRVLDYLKAEYGLDQAGLDRWCERWIGDGLLACEAILRRRERKGRFAFGDRPGLADVCLVPQMFSARRFNVDVSALEQLRAIDAACQTLPAFADAHPARQPDAEP